ncbi:MAG: hypothetical protein H0Z38_07265 [Firmicutes bacterium]|nr:hypothetical protein [Bacillota bacterium]
MTKRAIFVLSLLLVLGVSGAALAMELDARSYAMGGAYTAVVEDASAVYWNPAKIPDIRITSLVFSAGLGSENVEETLNALEKITNQEELDKVEINAQGAMLAALSTRWVGVGVYGNLALDASGEAVIDEMKPSEASAVATASARANGAVALAKEFSKFNLGLAIKKVVDYRFEQTEDVDLFGSKSKSAEIIGDGFSTDLAFSTGLGKIAQFGVVLQDIYSSLEYEKTLKTEGSEDEVTTYEDNLDPTIRAGVALRPGLGFTFSGDITNKGSLHLGAEKNLFWNGLSVRAGLASFDGVQEYRAGLGLNLLWVHLDLGVGFSSDSSTPAGAMLNASFSF